ncbi:hypothetical protein BCR44DRAFT_37969 [Catenaria anguillulae PL171]|uniref:26S proteasome non-ATPase regulatory subunit 5 n=1 Tax=Catenaria anguillulae PL171 TaxID=765915 RepID=A0A1Y2HR37_9FUNG|nr:hypothetical protein BCR44DRAFT_37969 [Catenaria anguillulae PL171]
MVHAIDMQTVSRAGANVHTLCDIVNQLHRDLSRPANNDHQDDLDSLDSQAIALTLESLCYHLKGDSQVRARSHVEHALSLDTLFFFLATEDALVTTAACDLIQAWIHPFPPARLLENEDLLIQGLSHPSSNVRVLVLSQLLKLGPGDWTRDLALAAVQSINHASVPVFDAFIHLITNEDTVTAMFANNPPVIDYLASDLLAHRTHAFRAIELIGRLARLSQPEMILPNARTLFSTVFSTRVLHNPMDYAVFCQVATSLLSPTSNNMTGNPANALTLLTDAGILSTILDRTMSHEDPEAGISLLLSVIAVNPAHPLAALILDTAAQFIAQGTIDTSSDHTTVLVLATLRALADLLPTNDPILAHAGLLKSLTDLVALVCQPHALPALLYSGTLQFLCATGPKPHGQALVTSLLHTCTDVPQSWIALALAATTHAQEHVQEAGFATLVAVASTEWAWQALTREDRLAFLMARATGESPEVRRVKYSVVERLAAKVQDATIRRKVIEFVKQGPYFTPRIASVSVSEAV